MAWLELASKIEGLVAEASTGDTWGCLDTEEGYTATGTEVKAATRGLSEYFERIATGSTAVEEASFEGFALESADFRLAAAS